MTTQEKLIAIYEAAENRLKEIISQKISKGSAAMYQKSLLKQVRQELKRLKKNSAAAVNAIVKESYRDSLSELVTDLKKAGGKTADINTKSIEPEQLAMSGLNKSQIAVVAENINYDFIRTINLVGRRIEDNIREAAVEATAEKLSTGQTVRQMQKNLIEKLQEQDITYVTYRNGRQVSLKSYAAMVSRTTTAEAQNTAKIVQANTWGYDLVKMTTHSPTCAICAMYQGRVYATTKDAANGKYRLKDGTVLRFPYIFDTAFASGYNTIHPNCRHRISAYPIKAYTGEEAKEIARISNAPFEDTRSDEERKKYSAMQSKNRQRLANRRQYERIKSVLPDTAPKSYSGFIRMKQTNSEKYQELMRDYRYVLRETERSKPKITNINSVVDRKIIESSDYRRQFDILGENNKVTRSVYQQAKAILTHRSGSNFEDLSYIDSLTGKYLTRSDYAIERQCMPSEAMKKMVSESEQYTIISLHNHPNSTVPSLDDLNSSYKKKYKYGIIACHNGNIFKYRVIGNYDEDFADMTLDRLNTVIYNKDVDNYKEKLVNVLKSLKENNIDMEVFLWQ